MDKKDRKSEIGFLAIVASMVKLVMDKGGVCNFGIDTDHQPYVHLQPWMFLQLFGEDTEFWYNEGKPDYRTINTKVNGVKFFALMTGFDLIEEGRLIA